VKKLTTPKLFTEWFSPYHCKQPGYKSPCWHEDDALAMTAFRWRRLADWIHYLGRNQDQRIDLNRDGRKSSTAGDMMTRLKN